MINIDALNDEEKLAALESIHKSIAESKEIQKKKITTNVEMIVKALKKIESDLKQRYDETGSLIANLKNGEDGRDGRDGKDGKDGRAGKDGAMGPRGYDGLSGRNGLDGEDGVSVTDAHIDFDGSLIIHLSSGRVINVGEVVAPDIAEKIKVITNGGGTSQFVIDTLASLQAQISAIVSGLDYQGTWNASTNTPTLASSVGVAGYYYIVATAGSTNLNGITDWQIGDWAVFNGSVWQKIDQSNLVTSVAGRTGAIVLTTADIGGLGTIATQNANSVSITGGSITGITDLAIADGGTGQSTAAAAITALTGTQTSGFYLRSNGTNSVLAAIQAADVPTLNQNTTGSASTITNTLPVSKGGTNLTALTNKGVLYASSTSQVATGTALQFDGTNLGVGTTQSIWGATFKAIEIGEQGSIAYENNGSTKKTYLSTNAYNATAIGARPYYKVSGLASEYTQDVGSHAWYTAPTGIAGSSTTITSGQIYTNLTAGNQPDFGAVNGLVGTIWTATSSGTLTSGTVVQNISFVESMRIDPSSNVGIGISNPGSRLDVKGTLRLSGSTSGYVGLAPAAAAGSTTYTLPSADGTSGQSLTTNGSGTLSWASSSGGTVTSVAASGGTTGLTFSGSPITTSGTLTLGGTLAVANGGTGTATPALVAGTNVTITGSWPNQTINSSNTGGTVTSVGGTGTVNGITLTGTVTTSGNLTLGGTLSGVSLTSQVTGTLPTANGGTNLTSFTANGVVYASSSSVLATGSALTFDGSKLTVNSNSTTTAGFFQVNDGTTTQANSFGSVVRNSNDGNGRYSLGAFTLQNASGLSQYAYIGAQSITGASNYTPDMVFGLSTGASTYAEQMRLTSTGLGIGTTGPVTKLQVNSGSTYVAGFKSTIANGFIAFQDSGTSGALTDGNVAIGAISNDLAFRSGGATRMRLDSAGNLGLGVTPSAWSSGKVVEIGNVGNAVWGNSPANVYLTENAYYDGAWKYGVTAGAATYQLNQNSHVWSIAPSGTAGNAITFTQAMTLDASGNLGVGTTSPQKRVHSVSAGTGLNEVLRVGNSQANGGGVGVKIGFQPNNDFVSNGLIGASISAVNTSGSAGNDIALVFGTGSGGSESERARIDSSGNLGIGTASPASKLSVVNSSSVQIQASTGTIDFRVQSIDANSAAFSGTVSNHPLAFTTNNAERARIDSSGNLLVGTTSAYSSGATPHLFVSANTAGSYIAVFKNANATPGCLILDLSADPNNGSDTYIATGQNRFKVLSNGNVQNTNNSYGAISDVKLKENIADATPKLADLMQVKVRNYNLIGETTRQIGVVAQELETVFPLMVDESFDRDAEGNDLGTTTKSVKYSVFVPMLIKAMQEQQAIIESLKARLDAANL